MIVIAIVTGIETREVLVMSALLEMSVLLALKIRFVARAGPAVAAEEEKEIGAEIVSGEREVELEAVVRVRDVSEILGGREADPGIRIARETGIGDVRGRGVGTRREITRETETETETEKEILAVQEIRRETLEILKEIDALVVGG